MTDASSAAIPHQSLPALFLRFLRFGALAWGGPVAQIAMIQRELVEQERWIPIERFHRALAVYQVLPGPEAHELCVYFGMLARGRTGAILAGVGFMLPGFLLMLALSALYAEGLLAAPGLAQAFAGAQIAVVALILSALLRIGRHAVTNLWLGGIAAAAFVADLLGVHFGLVLAFAGITPALAQSGRPRLALVAVLVVVAAAAVQLSFTAAPQVVPDGVPPDPVPPSLGALFVSGLRGGLLTFGGAYTAIPFLQHDAVVSSGYLTNGVFLDGLALSGVLPAPLIIFATFIGYVGGGVLGALVITIGIFLPAFCFTLIGHNFFERITHDERLRSLLAGVTAGVVGLMGATTVDLLRTGVRDVLSAVICVSALFLLWQARSRAAVPITILAAALAGFVLAGR